MQRRQKAILINFTIVITITIISVVVMVNVKDIINRSESLRAMNQLSKIVLEYKDKYGLVPPESHIEKIKINLEGAVRLGNLRYRSRWLDTNSGPDVILAYVEKKYSSPFVADGYILIRLNGKVERMSKKEFSSLLAKQQKPIEAEEMGKITDK
jgi:hypothetical protein